MALVASGAAGYLVQKMALHAGWDTGTLSQRDFLTQYLEACCCRGFQDTMATAGLPL